MQAIKQHIAIIILAGFLFPQAAGSLHYFVIDHSFSFGNDTSFTKPDVDFNYHSCVYHLNGISGFLPFEEHSWQPTNLPSPATFNFCSLDNYVLQPDFNFQLRGPPNNSFPSIKSRL